jgi:preprotein translocase subunit SecA
VHNLLAAHVLHRRDHDYIIKEGKVVLVDQSTGRPSFDRHLQYGLHRAIEAKEGLYPALDHQTAAEITFPGLFELYESFSGTSGTCLELASALWVAHKKKVVRIPPHRPVVRTDFADVLFSTTDDKLEALAAEVALAQRLCQPVLVGTGSVQCSEQVSEALGKAGIEHEVLNARHHEREAPIIARAGEPGAVTVATTMAGRGTDIRPPDDLPRLIAEAAATWIGEDLAAGLPGFRIEVRSDLEREELSAALRARRLPFTEHQRKDRTLFDLGQPPPTAFPLCLGMRVIGFERLVESRLDRQLRGRTGRQGAPGSTRFYLSLDDEVLLVHGDRARVAELNRRASRRRDPLSDRPTLSHSRLLEEAQRAFLTVAELVGRQRERQRLLDRVDQDQRQHYDAERRALLFASGETISRLADEAIFRAARDLVSEAQGEREHLTFTALELLDDLTQIHFERRRLLSFEGSKVPPPERAAEALAEALLEHYSVARRWHGRERMAQVERAVLLDALTESWRLLAAERPELREQADLHAYAGKKPELVYRSMAGVAYHRALAIAARTAASVLVTFPLPREIKTSRTGLTIDEPLVIALACTSLLHE